MDTEIRLARSREARAIANLSRRFVEWGLRWRWRPEAIVRCIQDPNVEVIVAGGNERILGFAIMEFLGDEAHLVLMAVAPPFRRLGIGRQLMAWLVDMAEVAMTTRVRLEVRERNTGARRFYRSLGFREVGSVAGYYQGQENAVKLIRPL